MFGSVGNFVGNLITNHQTMSHQDFWNRQNIALQKEFAQNSLKWRVEDAKRAGVHPMAALGITPASFSPVNSSINLTDLGAGLGEMGQNIDRAIQVGKDSDARQKAEYFQDAQNGLQLRNMELQNDFLQAQIDSMKAVRNTALPPAAPTTNPDNVPLSGVNKVADEVIASPSDNPSVTAGTHPLWTHARSGRFVLPVLSDKVADAVTENKEKNVGAEIAYAIDAWNGDLKPPHNAFTAREHQLIKSGEYAAYYYPFLGWRVEPKVSWANFKKFVLGGFAE